MELKRFNPEGGGTGEKFIGVNINGEEVESIFREGDYYQGDQCERFLLQWTPAGTFIQDYVYRVKELSYVATNGEKVYEIHYYIENGTKVELESPPTVLKGLLERVDWGEQGCALLRIVYLGKKAKAVKAYHMFDVAQKKVV